MVVNLDEFYEKVKNNEYSKKDLKDMLGELNMLAMQRAVILPDIHVPYEDDKALDLALKVIKKYKPERIIQLGDMYDFYSISRFDKHPDRIDSLQQELNRGFDIWKTIKKKSKNSLLEQLTGNHEVRLRKYLYRHPELYSLDCMKFENITRLDELDVKHYDVEDICYLNDDLIVTHGANDDGCKLSQYAGYSAKNTLEKLGINGISGHCFDKETEILTKRGWINGLELKETDEVGTMNKKTQKFEWNKINEIFVFDNYKQLYKIKGTTTDLLITNKHGLIIEKHGEKIKEVTAEEIKEEKGKFYIFNAIPHQSIKPISFEWELKLRLLINIITDGAFEGNAIRWHLKKTRKIIHLKEILDLLDYTYTETKMKDGTTKIYLGVGFSKPIIDTLNGKKELPEYIKDLSKREADIILEEYSITDGCKNSDAVNSYQISSSKEKEIDILQELFVKNKYRTSKIKRIKDQSNPNYCLTINTRYKQSMTKKNVSIVPYSGKVWCVNVDNGTLIVRRNGKTAITLNSHRQASVYKRDYSGTKEWHEIGCLCGLNPDYCKKPNWQQGFAVVDYDKKQFNVQNIPIKGDKKKRCIVDGKEFK